MSTELRDLYQELVVDHSNHPRNFRKLEGATRTAEGINPLCGDQLTLYVKLADGLIEDIAFQGAGCAISKASASLMTQALKGRKQAEALALFARVHSLLTQGPKGEVTPEELGKLAALSGVWEFPVGQVRHSRVAHTAKRPRREGRTRVNGVEPWHLICRRRSSA